MKQGRKKSFDNIYKNKEEIFGQPYKELQEYFTDYPKRGTVLDLGCGQGRDSIFLASLGYQVTAVDNSKIGVTQMIKKSKKQKLNVKSIVADIINLKLNEKFDTILFDMLLHSFEKSQQSEILRKYSDSLNKNGMLCIIFPDDMSTDHFLNILKSLSHDWKLVEEITINDIPKIDKEDIDFSFIMIVVQRIS